MTILNFLFILIIILIFPFDNPVPHVYNKAIFKPRVFPCGHAREPERRKQSMNRRVLAFAVCAGLILALLSSSLLIIAEADHDCSGEGCGVCAHMAEARAFLRGMACAAAAMVAAPAFLCLLRLLLRVRASSARRSPSLVSLRVRLDN